MPSDQNITESFNPWTPRKDGAPSVHNNTELPYKSKEITMTRQTFWQQFLYDACAL